MKVFISLLCLVSLALSEPPVGDGYPNARSSHDHHHDHDHEGHNDHASEQQRSLSQEYGPPSSTRNAPGYEYNEPNSRSSNLRGRSQFAPPSVRVSFNQRFGSSAARNAAQDTTKARSFSQDRAAPNTRSGISQEYGLPASRTLSQEYGVPSVASARTPSNEYGVPNTRSSPSEEYGAPVIAARSNQKSHTPTSNFRSAQPARSVSQNYIAPAARSQSQADSRSYTAPSTRSNERFQGHAASQSPSSTYNAPSGSPSSSYGTPSTRNSNSQIDDSFGASNGKELSETYGVPSARSLSSEYGVPSGRSNLNTNAVASSYASASSRSAPSSTYLPAARDGAPSQQYGVPQQDDSQGYNDAKARALNELLNQEPANYDFAYQIEDSESGSDFGHTETRQDNRAEGSYFVVLPDGTKQTVEYEADERGFKPRISVKPAAGGYDENAADITSSSGGPY